MGLARVFLGYVAACLVAAIIQFAFAWKPVEVSADGAAAAEMVALIATQFAIFAAPYAAVATVLGEWLAIRAWGYYAGSGLAIAASGFLAQYASESGGATILNPYAAAAFFAPGVVAGWIYWVVSGRHAGSNALRVDQSSSE